jgi:hypothetical protein
VHPDIDCARALVRWPGAVAYATAVVFIFTSAMTITQQAGASTRGYPPVPNTATIVPPACTTPSHGAPILAGKIAAQERAITAFVGNHFQALGQCGPGLLSLTLTPGSEALAKRVRIRFGSVVQILVGETVWDGRPGRSPRCGNLPTTSTIPAGYSATLDLRSTKVKSGANLTGTVKFKDTGTSDVRIDPGEPIEMVVTKPHTRRVVGIYSGAIGGVGYSKLLQPGHTAEVDAIGGTARCDGGLGSALPPGRYDAVAEVSGVGVNGSDGSSTPPPTYDTSFDSFEIVSG